MTSEVSYRFVFNERMGIAIPEMDREWPDYSHEEQVAILVEWERIKARIPDRILEFETEIEAKGQQAAIEDDWDRVCELYSEYYAIASIINDLNIWSKVEPNTTAAWLDSIEEVGLAEEHANREK
jgi:hypothetical protein